MAKILQCPWCLTNGLFRMCMNGRFPCNCDTCDSPAKQFVETTATATSAGNSEWPVCLKENNTSIEDRIEKLHTACVHELEKIQDKSSNAALLLLGSKSALERLCPELKDGEDERIRKGLISMCQTLGKAEWVAWLEKQGEHAKFRDSIQVGDKVTRNEDGVLVNLSQLNRVAKKDEKRGEQKPVDKIEPKFKVGEWIINAQGTLRHIINVDKGGYQTDGGWLCHDTYEKTFHLWTIQDAKDGDVLATLDYILIFKKLLPKDGGVSYCYYDFGCSTPHFNFNEDDNWYFGKEAKVYPATKEQRDLLFQKMKEAGYEWDAEKKELKKVEHKPWSEEVDLELVTDWFGHIAQIADDRMTLTGRRMTDSHALDEIKCIAKNCSEFITKHYKEQKGE